MGKIRNFLNIVSFANEGVVRVVCDCESMTDET